MGVIIPSVADSFRPIGPSNGALFGRHKADARLLQRSAGDAEREN